jgi:hypothetical protein
VAINRQIGFLENDFPASKAVCPAVERLLRCEKRYSVRQTRLLSGGTGFLRTRVLLPEKQAFKAGKILPAWIKVFTKRKGLLPVRQMSQQRWTRWSGARENKSPAIRGLCSFAVFGGMPSAAFNL